MDATIQSLLFELQKKSQQNTAGKYAHGLPVTLTQDKLFFAGLEIPAGGNYAHYRYHNRERGKVLETHD